MDKYPNLFPRARIKDEAKRMLSPNWGPVLGITLLYLLFLGVDSFMYSDNVPATINGFTDSGSFSYTVSGAAGIYAYGMANGNMFVMSLIALISGVLIQGVLGYSYTAYFVKLTQSPGRKMGFGVFVEGFNDAIKAALAFLWQYLWMMIWGLTAIPGIVFLFVGLFGAGSSDALYVALSFIGLGLLIVSMVLVVMATIRYSFMYQVIADSRGKVGARQAMRYSIAIVKTRIADVFILGLSFIPWMIFGTFTFGIGFFYVIPYMQATYAHAYGWLRDDAFREGRLDPAVLGYMEARVTHEAAPANADAAEDVVREEVVPTVSAAQEEAPEASAVQEVAPEVSVQEEADEAPAKEDRHE